MTILILHGHDGHPGIHWQQYIHDELTKAGHTVIMPDLIPHNNPKREEWVSKIKEVIVNTDDDLILIGHSLGVPTGLYAIQELGRKVTGFISVAGFMSHIDFEPADNVMDTPFDTYLLNELIESMYIIYSPTDPYIPQKNSKELIAIFKANEVVIDDGGHFESNSPYSTEFTKLLETVNSMVR